MSLDWIWPWAIAFIPALLYVWLYYSYVEVIRNKREEITGLLARGGAMAGYIKAYGKQGFSGDHQDPGKIAARILIRNNYAPLSYKRALAFTAFLTTLATVVAMARAGLPITLPHALVEFIVRSSAVPAMLAGCAGAFVWGLYELLRRYGVGDLTPSVIYFTGIRLLVLAGVGPALSTVLKSQFSWAVAFGLGVIPLNTISEIASEPTRRALKLPVATAPRRDGFLSFIQGLNPEMIDRLNEADV
jgi:hypothetical protein